MVYPIRILGAAVVLGLVWFAFGELWQLRCQDPEHALCLLLLLLLLSEAEQLSLGSASAAKLLRSKSQTGPTRS
jgi:hypothetical protein